MTSSKRLQLSPTAVRLLDHICTESRRLNSPLTLAQLWPAGPSSSNLNTMHVLADRWLIVIDGGRIRPRSAGFRLLAGEHCRSILSRR